MLNFYGVIIEDDEYITVFQEYFEGNLPMKIKKKKSFCKKHHR